MSRHVHFSVPQPLHHIPVVKISEFTWIIDVIWYVYLFMCRIIITILTVSFSEIVPSVDGFYYVQDPSTPPR